MTDFDKYKSKLDIIRKTFDNSLDELAEEIRQEVIIPACKKYKVNFKSGNGAYFFYNQKWDIDVLSYPQNLPDKTADHFDYIFSILRMEPEHNSCLGLLVRDFEYKKIIRDFFSIYGRVR